MCLISRKYTYRQIVHNLSLVLLRVLFVAKKGEQTFSSRVAVLVRNKDMCNVTFVQVFANKKNLLSYARFGMRVGVQYFEWVSFIRSRVDFTSSLQHPSFISSHQTCDSFHVIRARVRPNLRLRLGCSEEFK